MDPVLHLRGCRVDLVAGLVHPDRGEPRRLTSREVALLAYLARTPGAAVSVDVLEKHVWGMSERAVSRAVSAAVRRLRPKIEPPGGEVVNLQTVHGVGWVLHLLSPIHGDEPPQLAPIMPAPTFDAFVGRQDVLAKVLAAVSEGVRLISVTGPGGVGKSRLVVEALHSPELNAGDSPRVVYVNVDESPDISRWTLALAAALGLAIGPKGLLVALELRLRAFGSALLVLDNIEVNEGDTARLISSWLLTCPKLQVITTCRRTLKLRSERVVRLHGLSPVDAAALLTARMRQRGFDVADDDEGVRRVVDTLGGLPLALELASSQACTVGLGALLASLRQPGDRQISSMEMDRPARHRSLHDLVASSWKSLSNEDKSLLSALAVFAGPIDPEWAVGITARERPLLWQGLGRLVDASLLLPRGGLLSMPVVIRNFLMAVAPPSPEACLRHARWALERPDRERRADLTRAALNCPDAELAAQCAINAVDQLLQIGASAQAIELAEDTLLRRPSLPAQARLGMLRLRGLALAGPLESAANAADSLLDQEWLGGDLRVEVAALAARVLRGAPRQVALSRLEHTVRSPRVTSAGKALGLRTLAGRYADEGDRDLAISTLEQAIHIAQDHDLGGDEAWCRLLRAHMLGTAEAAGQAIDWVQGASQAGLDTGGRIALSRVMAQVAWVAGRGATAVEQAELSISLAEREGKHLDRRDALVLLAAIQAEQGWFERARARLDTADSLGMPHYSSCLARLRLAIGCEALPLALAALRSLDLFDTDHNALHRRLWILEGRAEVALLAGKPWEAAGHARLAVQSTSSLAPQYAVTPLALLGRSLVALKRTSEASELAAQAVQRSAINQIPYDRLQAWLLRGEVSRALGVDGGVDQAREVCEPILAAAGCTPHSQHVRRLVRLAGS